MDVKTLFVAYLGIKNSKYFYSHIKGTCYFYTMIFILQQIKVILNCVRMDTAVPKYIHHPEHMNIVL